MINSTHQSRFDANSLEPYFLSDHRVNYDRIKIIALKLLPVNSTVALTAYIASRTQPCSKNSKWRGRVVLWEQLFFP